MAKATTMEKLSPKLIWSAFKNAISGFSEDKVFKLSASLAYCTTFSLGPLLLIIISLTSLFFGREAVEGRIFGQLQSFVGRDTAAQLQHIIQNAAVVGKGKIAAIIGGIALLFGATSVFGEIQDSINMIWGLKPKPKKSWVKFLQNRLLSFSVIIGLGFLLLVSLVFTSLIDAFSGQLKQLFPQLAFLLFYLINIILTFLVSTLIFAVVFKVLPDAKIRWREVIAGAVLTAILFMAGKFAISYYISRINIGTTYGTAGSLVILLLWVYYSSVILYFGAEFTQSYAIAHGAKIAPADFAVVTKQLEVETGAATIPLKKKNSSRKTK
jgi:membrane protein